MIDEAMKSHALLATNMRLADLIAGIHATLAVILPTVVAVWSFAAYAEHHLAFDITAANRAPQ